MDACVSVTPQYALPDAAWRRCVRADPLPLPLPSPIGCARSKATCIAYETVEKDGMLPVLAPMSEIAGRLSIQQGMRFLEKHVGGSGMLLAGVPGVAPGNVVVIGGGVSGQNAASE